MSNGTSGTAQGIDVSHYQGTANWDEVRKAWIEFAFAKATDACNRFSTSFKTWARKAPSPSLTPPFAQP